MLRCCFTVLICLYLNFGFTNADELPGIVTEKPGDGFFVKTEQGWMVPYDVTIPVTEIMFLMLPIPAGEFVMGSSAAEAGRKDDEGPTRRVLVEPYWMAECEVKWEEYKLFMQLYRSLKEFEELRIRTVTDENKVDAVTAPTPLYEPDFTFEYGEDPKQPAVSMTQYAAKQYTKWLTGITGQQFRLPTEAEWEYCCRAGTDTLYSFGDTTRTQADAATASSILNEYAWHTGNAAGNDPAVGVLKPNPWGLFDMHGYLWEYVSDTYDASPASTPRKATAGASTRIIRSGSWRDHASHLTSGARLPIPDHVSSDAIGFRCVIAEKPQP